ncbi:hypothetical protein [Janibacter limosus]|uniref:hypothetical protein n=1 Tax=Janibacter limosus TaxID=53458 RepID=UPI000829D38F|nr:hypothetical protein [Janibacter limosus]
MTTEVRYVDTQDAALTVTWREHLLTTADGDPLPINVQDTLTVTANAPGDLPKGTMLTIGGPTVNDGTDWTTAFEGATIVTALLDGVDVADQISQDPVAPGDDVFTWRINVVIPAGQSLVIDVDVDVTTQTRRSVYDGAWSQVLSTGDRDESNNRADTGPYPTR